MSTAPRPAPKRLTGLVTASTPRPSTARGAASPPRPLRGRSVESNLSEAELKAISAYERLLKAQAALLQATGAATLDTAIARARAVLARRDDIRRRLNKQPPAGKKKSVAKYYDGPSTSVRTVSGGAPTLGKHR